jgi:hypothetical protein
MNKSTRTVIAAAAMAGLYSGALALRASASIVNAGSAVAHHDDSKDGKSHDCKGKNSCKGNGGCQSGDNGCKGKNTCSGKGGCKTNDSSDKKNT